MHSYRRAACCALLVVALAAAFQQDAQFIENNADTNTQEDFDWQAWQASKSEKSSLLRGTKATAKELNVFILPHSHDDPGWVRTSDQYFEFFVRHIYTTAVEALAANKERKFQAVEMVYFHQWWTDARTTDTLRENARRQIAEKRLEFAVGGWVMPDEAITDYPDLIETMSVGHEFITSEFGEDAAPRFGFQVDPFGASSAFAALSAKMGFNGHLVARLNYYDKGWMQDNKELEFVWRPDASLKQDGDAMEKPRVGDITPSTEQPLEIFTHIMDQYQYSSPGIPLQAQIDNLCAPPHNRSNCPGGGFLWDGDDSQPAWYWTAQQKKQGFSVYPAANASNVAFYAEFLVNNTRQRSEWFATDNLLWPFGTDFQHFNASEMFDSMDKVIAEIRRHAVPGGKFEGVNVQYGMLSDYFSAVHKSGRTDGKEWRVRKPDEGDFLPYNTLNCGGSSNDFKHTCSSNAGPQFNVSWPQTWSGFYTSHSTLKISQRRHAQALRHASGLAALATARAHADANGSKIATDTTALALRQQLREQVTPLQHAVGLLPHHDSVTGTMGPGCGNSLPGADPNKCNLGQTMGAANNAGAVDADYEKYLAEGWKQATPAVEEAANALLNLDKADFSIDSTDFDATLAAGKPAALAVSNSLGWQAKRWVRLLLPETWRAGQKVTVTAVGSGNTDNVEAEVMPGGALACADPAAAPKECAPTEARGASRFGMSHDADAVAERDESRFVLWFRATIPPLGIAQYIVTPGPSSADDNARFAPHVQDVTLDTLDISANGTLKVSSRFFELEFDVASASLSRVRDLTGNIDVDVAQSLQQYTSFHAESNDTSIAVASDGTESRSWSLNYLGARSGSYLLHPSAGAPDVLAPSVGFKAKLQLVKGAAGQVTEVRQRLSDTASQVWRLFGQDKDEDAAGHIQLQLGVGPLGGNKEIVTRFGTSIQTVAPNAANEGTAEASIFYTDNNGWLEQRRQFSARRSFPDGTSTVVAPDDSYATSLNFYPIVRTAYINDYDQSGNYTHFSIVTPQSGAVTSRRNGELQLMMHRRSLQDDAKGACQVFNDTSGQYANLPNDTSAGTTCASYSSMGTCRADACPSFAIPMNISTRVEPKLAILTGGHEAEARRPRLAQAVNNPPLLLYAGTVPSDSVDVAPMHGLGLPSSVHLLTLRPLSLPTPQTLAQTRAQAAFVLRLQHIGEARATASGGVPAEVDFARSGLCSALGGSDAMVESRTLSGLFATAGPTARPRWSWRDRSREAAAAATSDAGHHTEPSQIKCSDVKLSIGAGDIRTFWIYLKH